MSRRPCSLKLKYLLRITSLIFLAMGVVACQKEIHPEPLVISYRTPMNNGYLGGVEPWTSMSMNQFHKIII
ncbi:MAG: hypothetical protein R2827_12445 [Bdellovibrionales bacterium]